MKKTETIYFSGEEYDRLTGPYATGEDFEHYRRLADRANGPVLELACGTGRLTIPLAGAGIKITGLDSSEEMLGVARRKAAEWGSHTSFVQGDMRRFDFGESRFALIFVPVNSLSHLLTAEDIDACFSRARAHLMPGGCFAFDLFNPSLALLTRAPEVRSPIRSYIDASGRQVTLSESNHYDAATQVNHITWYYEREGDPPSVTAYPLAMRQFFPQEIDLIARYHGFEIEAKYGDYSGGAFTSESPKQILLLRPDQ